MIVFPNDLQLFQPPHVLVVRGKGLVGWLIRRWVRKAFGERGAFSHAALIISPDKVFDAQQGGVRFRRLDSFQRCSAAVVLEPRFRWTRDSLARAMRRVLALQGAGYDYRALWSLGAAETFDRWFCSELVFAFLDELHRYDVRWPIVRCEIATPDDVFAAMRPVWFSGPEARRLTYEALDASRFKMQVSI